MKKIDKTLDIDTLAKEIREGVSSKEGLRTLTNSLDSAKKWTTKVTESQKVDPKMLHEPFTL